MSLVLDGRLDGSLKLILLLVLMSETVSAITWDQIGTYEIIPAVVKRNG